MIKRRSSISCNFEVVEVAASSELESSIVGVAASREGLAAQLSSCGNLYGLAISWDRFSENSSLR